MRVVNVAGIFCGEYETAGESAVAYRYSSVGVDPAIRADPLFSRLKQQPRRPMDFDVIPI